jgi:hypothetical protein
MQQYLHTAKYGNPGGAHTMKPMFVKKDNHIFKSEYHPDVIANQREADKALYHVKGDKVYTSAAHPDGPGPHAVFHIREDGKIHTTEHHPQHNPGQHVFELGDAKPDPSFIEKVIKNA